MEPDKTLPELQDLLEILIQQGQFKLGTGEILPPDMGGPKGPNFQRAPGPIPSRPPMGESFPSNPYFNKQFQGDQPQPNRNFLEWLMQHLRGRMWGRDSLPNEQLDQWLQQQQQLPRRPGRWT